MFVRRALVIVAAMAAVVPMVGSMPAQAKSPSPNLVFQIALHPVSGDVHDLPGGVSYGQSQLAGTTKWGQRSAKVEWMCSHVTTNGVGPAHDLVTVKRSDGVELALAVNGRIANDTFRGTADVIGGTGAYSNATGTGTVVGSTGKATISLTIFKAGRSLAIPRAQERVGC